VRTINLTQSHKGDAVDNIVAGEPVDNVVYNDSVGEPVSDVVVDGVVG
jgi:hypothetical protein